ncbi:MAG TPA: peptidoglycan bridge formation glycyltransferase FemA/FemB family protein [Lacunisphaera sp.]|nr:peptidoglycan bridge formation glycyltransferase FemA/FemB family protein [Lacunisphaera sp.]
MVTPLTFTISDKLDDPEWDAFVLAHPDPHHEQTSLWGRVRSAYGWKAVRLIAHSNGRIVGGAQILEHRIARFFTVGYVPRGPLLAEAVDTGMVVAEIKRLVRARGLTYLAVSLPYFAQSLVPTLEKNGFQSRPDRLPPAVWTKATATIDLDRDEEAIMAAISATKRKQIRRAQRAGIVVRQGGKEDLPAFEALLVALCKRRGVSSNIPLGKGLDSLWDAFVPGGHLKLLVAELHGAPLSALLLVAVGEWVRAWRIGWSGQHEKECPSHLIYWEAIRWARQQGYKHFDILGVDVRDARELLAGRDRAAPYHCQTTYAKMGFGGELLLLPGEYCYFPNAGLRFLFRSIGARVLDSKLILKILGYLHSRSARPEG